MSVTKEMEDGRWKRGWGMEDGKWKMENWSER
jgi:hypothetical protein